MSAISKTNISYTRPSNGVLNRFNPLIIT